MRDTNRPGGVDSTPRCLPREEPARWVGAGAVLLVLALRSAQALTMSPLFHSPEYLQLGNLCAARAEGRPLWPGGPFLEALRAVFEQAQYMPFAQGTVVISFGALALCPLTGPSSWALHAIAIMLEALTVGLLWRLLLGKLGVFSQILALLAWILVPAFAASWQFLPYGNHTAFLFVPVVLGALSMRDRQSVSSGCAAFFLMALGFVAYRLNLSALIAFGLALSVGRPRRESLLGLLLPSLALLLALFLLRGVLELWGSGAGEEVPRQILAPHFAPSLEALGPNLLRAFQWVLPGAPRALLEGLPYRIVLLLGWPAAGWVAMGTLDSPVRRLSRFALAFTFFALAAPLSSSGGCVGQSQYLLPGLYGLLLCWISAVSAARAKWSLGQAALALLTLLGAVDNVAMVRPACWAVNRHYNGVEFWRQMQVVNLDPDEILFYARLLDEKRGNRSVGLASETLSQGCLEQPGRVAQGPLASPEGDYCSGWRRGALASRILELQQSGESIDLDAVGRGAFIVCQRDLMKVEAALEGLQEDARTRVLSGAEDEASRYKR